MDGIRSSLALRAAAALFPLFAAADSVIFNGTLHACTNTCTILLNNGNYTVRDCCGGRVRYQIP